ncbi:MAG: L-histidine N(alpha)-methyltransferase [Mesorhizobium sp.]|uniref:L-histidine N(alpha)-methyltransferase n=1 Tax=Mesorhizobium sp. TaxID=1871066 RepID=UPI000FE7FAD1|nr:L-histidine N(alpha)-methyltransferase [Mesorhizobium sp.]RWP83461.1 MAG: L-histidine N(alpha)-methyltransferase [Mesorhizobium sp.]
MPQGRPTKHKLGERKKRTIIGADLPETEIFRGDVLIRSLSGSPRSIGCMYYYDDTGSALFERLCQEESYYLFRAEKEILAHHAISIAEITGPVSLVELGAGNAQKTTLLIDAYMENHGSTSYAAIDINRSILEKAAENLLSMTPDLHFTGIIGVYQTGLEQAATVTGQKLLVCLGASLGNMYDDELHGLLDSVHSLFSVGDYFLVGIDLDKSSDILEEAYNNQSAILTNLCVLQHLNWRFDGNFNVFQFRHVAFHNKSLSRMEAHLEATQAQFINLGKLEFSFFLEKGERIRTEIMRKVNLNTFNEIFIKHGLNPVHHWTDSEQRYAACLFQIVGGQDNYQSVSFVGNTMVDESKSPQG